jgi:hypothetical protein
VSRRLSFLAALVVAVVAVAPALARDPLDEQRRITKTDSAFAGRVSLQRSDLPASFVRRSMPNDDSSNTCNGRKPDLSQFTITGESDRAYQDSSRAVTILSSVTVFKSVGDARGDYARSVTPVLAKCMQSLLGSDRLHVTSSTFGPNVGVGEASARYRVVANVSGANGTIPVHIDMLVMRQGRVLGLLATIAPLRSPTGQEILLATMAARAQKAPSA